MSRYELNLGAMTNMSGGYKTRGAISPKVLARIIVVDDEDFIRDLYRDMFESKGHTVYSARNGDEAIRYLKTMSVRPDAIIMDHRMPGKDGIQTTKEILSIDPNIPIIFSSADEEARNDAIEAGAISFWAKPFPIRLLIDATVDLVKARRK
ncbi:MAG: response regulator [Methanobacteriota archaeon]|nr:MAG: response regulator [Euryarchaeota archaeon]